MNHGTTFPRFAKIDVNGKNAAPLYVWLKEQVPEDKGNEETRLFEEKVKAFQLDAKTGDIKWNFGKFLIRTFTSELRLTQSRLAERVNLEKAYSY